MHAISARFDASRPTSANGARVALGPRMRSIRTATRAVASLFFALAGCGGATAQSTDAGVPGDTLDSGAASEAGADAPPPSDASVVGDTSEPLVDASVCGRDAGDPSLDCMFARCCAEFLGCVDSPQC